MPFRFGRTDKVLQTWRNYLRIYMGCNEENSKNECSECSESMQENPPGFRLTHPQVPVRVKAARKVALHRRQQQCRYHESGRMTSENTGKPIQEEDYWQLVREVAASRPPLTDEQRDEIRATVRGARMRKEAERATTAKGAPSTRSGPARSNQASGSPSRAPAA